MLKKTINRIKEYWPYIILGVFLILSTWAILSIGMNLIPLIEVNGNYNFNSLNIGLVNLSYSYWAGCIFYFLTSVFPRKLEKKRILPAIKLKNQNIGRKLGDIILEFSRETKHPNYSDVSNEAICKELLDSKDWNDFMPMFIHLYKKNIRYIEFITDVGTQIFKEIDEIINGYKYFLTIQQISLLEELRNDPFFSRVNRWSFMSTDFSTSEQRKFFIEEMCKMIRKYNTLKQTFK
uniref:hypothetical protein n=1 Tax=Alistipes sp. D31t1_170403_E11 TaxID=2787128 RepID=UPI0018973D0D|nr:hypothetical protein [Alistipes sp. D31t1_170403_E11]